MKVAVTSPGSTLEAALDGRFGRAARFILYDTDDGSFSVLDNTQNLNAPQGAGIQSARNVAASGAAVVITGHTGPKAYAVLAKAGIGVYHSDAPTVREALDAFAAGNLAAAEGADVEGHW